MLSCEQVSLTINKKKILSDINLQLGAGLHVLLGPNGAGKTSLIKCLSGELHATLGNIQLQQQALTSIKNERRAQMMAVLPQKSELRFRFSVHDVVQLGRLPHSSGASIDNAIVEQCLAALDLQKFKLRDYTQLSGGEQQRCQLARVLCQIWRSEDAEQRILLLDEPTAALDVKHQYSIMRLLKQLAQQGMCIIVSMHDFNLAAQFADQLIVLKEGRLIEQGGVEDIMREDLFSFVFESKSCITRHPETAVAMANFYV